jgi:hypothetical protein
MYQGKGELRMKRGTAGLRERERYRTSRNGLISEIDSLLGR